MNFVKAILIFFIEIRCAVDVYTKKIKMSCKIFCNSPRSPELICPPKFKLQDDLTGLVRAEEAQSAVSKLAAGLRDGAFCPSSG
ncbi:Uncharacterised protein [Legionella cincinnatiensis]|uniref:Uncharacterized protein n=1 Tax=Legionella cincinnatiensis TaxID=28085 RepID=A0A378IQJ1_9GAMM|nr:hypothetical protein Lcin_0578 [Legionella cincinnatiensis]STX34284.1 Uncharacterised protein [Legionella cincinnatiensis]